MDAPGSVWRLIHLRWDTASLANRCWRICRNSYFLGNNKEENLFGVSALSFLLQTTLFCWHLHFTANWGQKGEIVFFFLQLMFPKIFFPPAFKLWTADFSSWHGASPTREQFYCIAKRIASFSSRDQSKKLPLRVQTLVCSAVHHWKHHTTQMQHRETHGRSCLFFFFSQHQIWWLLPDCS